MADFKENRNIQVRVEIPLRSNEKERTISQTISEVNKLKVKTSIPQNRLEFTESPETRSPKGNATSSIISSSSKISGSSPNGGKVTIRSNEGLLSHEMKICKYHPVASSITQQRTSIQSSTPAITKALSPGSGKEGQSQEKAADRGLQTPVDRPKKVPLSTQILSPPQKFDTIIISDDEGDDEQGENLIQSPQIPQTQQSAHHETDQQPGRVIPASIGHKFIKTDIFESTGDTDSNDEIDILVSRPAPTTSDSNHNFAQPIVQDNLPSRQQSLKISNSTAASPLSSLGLSDQPFAPAILPSSHSSKHPKSSPAVIPDTDSEDDLAVGEQLLDEFKGNSKKVTETADSLLRRFQKQPSKQLHPPSSPPKSLVHKESSKSSTKYKALMIPSSTRRKPSMTSPFPSGKPIRRNIPPRIEEKPQSFATKALILPGDSENDSSTKKRKRDKLVGSWRTVRPFDDPEAEWSPKG